MGIQITIEKLHKVYQKGPEQVHILKGIDLEIDRGGHVAFTGVSGAGKSTLLHILGTLERPTSGTVCFDDAPIFAQTDRGLAGLRNHRVGFVFQFHHLLEDFTAAENVAMPLYIRRMSRSDALAQAEQTLARVGLEHRTTHLPAELSGGEQQRVAIARALVGRPELLLMDEPTGNLDQRTADDVHELIMHIAIESGATMIVVTHNEEFAGRLPVRYHLVDGKIQA